MLVCRPGGLIFDYSSRREFFKLTFALRAIEPTAGTSICFGISKTVGMISTGSSITYQLIYKNTGLALCSQCALSSENGVLSFIYPTIAYSCTEVRHLSQSPALSSNHDASIIIRRRTGDAGEGVVEK